MKWISIKDKLPEDNRPVLLFTPFEYFGELHSCVGNSESIRKCSTNSGNVKSPIFTHWFPLPEAPSINNRICE
jgi:uncharacterized protein DUF551